MRKYICVLIISLSFILGVAAKVTTAEQFDYFEETGADRVKITWRLEKRKNSIVLTSTKSTGRVDIYTNNPSLASLQWESKNPSQNTDILAKRDKNVILISGTLEGETIAKKVKIDRSPWYQSLSFSLTSLAKSDKASNIFWVLRPNDLAAVKMKARKIKTESIKAGGRKVEAERIKVVLPGFRSMFWHGLYWFRKDDGVFIKYQGKKGPPGTPITVTTLTKEGK